MKRATLPSSARPSSSKRCAGTTANECGIGPSTSETWSSTSSKAATTATSSPSWEGPYVVVEVLRPGAYKLKTIDDIVFVNAWNIE